MKKEDCVEIGYIAKAHGLKGEVTAILDVFDLSDYLKIRKVYLSRKTAPLQDFNVKKLTPSGKKSVILSLENISTREQAESIIGSTLYYPAENLPALSEGNFYFFEVLGFTVEDKNLGILGTVKDFADGPAQSIMIMEYRGVEILIPVTDAFVPKADLEKKTVYTILPEGLLELYMDPDAEEED
ncbi:MAG: ribosome maturation factor RimM [Bacteroidia bacterium]|nr:ribosome maturation factor RimM [Bacteroidia bacterium]